MTAAPEPAPPADVMPTGVGGGAPAPVEPFAVARAATLGRSDPVRSWTPLGTVDAGVIATVDAAGLVRMGDETWSLDWWIGAEDRWHHPSSDAAVRQRLLGDSPIVETAMRVPGGDVVQRVFGVRATSGGDDDVTWEDSGVVIEIENQTAVPVALALVLRPWTLDGPGSIQQLEGDGPVLRADGRVAAVLSRPASRRVAGPVGTVAARLAATDDEAPEGIVTAGASSVEAAFVVPLPHTAVVRVLLPRVERTGGSGRGRRSRVLSEPGVSWDAPSAEAIEAGWAAHTRDAARVELPESLLDSVVTASERVLSIASTVGFFDGDGVCSAAVRNAELCDVLGRAGLREPLGPLARALVGSERLGGSIRMADGSDATVALLHAAAPLMVGPTSEMWTDELLGPVAKAIHRMGRGKGLGEPALVRSAVIALGRVEPSLRSVGQPEVADAALELAGKLRDSISGQATVGESEPTSAASAPLFARAQQLRARIATGDPATAAELLALARIGQPGVLADRVTVEGDACGPLGLDPAAVAARMAAVLDLVVLEGADGPVVLPAWSAAWFGQAIEAHAVRTRWGSVSYAVRWHGERPAILWEVEPLHGVDATGPGPVFTAPGLDPEWRGVGWTGEALLGRLVPPDGLEATTLVADHMQSGQRVDDADAAVETAVETAVDAAAGREPAPPSFPGEGVSFS